MKNIAYHGITEIGLSGVETHLNQATGKDFCCRTLFIKMADGSTESLSLFSDDGYSLLVDDKDLAGMSAQIPLLEAA